MTSKQFAGWMAYASVEPFGPRQEEWRAGIIASLLSGPMKGTDKRPGPADFFPSLGELTVARPKQQPVSQMKMMCRLLARSGRGVYTPGSDGR